MVSDCLLQLQAVEELPHGGVRAGYEGFESGSKEFRGVVPVRGLPLHRLFGSVDSDLHMLLLVTGVGR